jgi:hypothetical protein
MDNRQGETFMKGDPAEKNIHQSQNSETGPFIYEIMVQGQLDLQRSIWFEGMVLTLLEDKVNRFTCTVISGPVVDQPALHGLLTKIRDLNLTLLSVRRLTPQKNKIEDSSARPEPTIDQDVHP